MEGVGTLLTIYYHTCVFFLLFKIEGWWVKELVTIVDTTDIRVACILIEQYNDHGVQL